MPVGTEAKSYLGLGSNMGDRESNIETALSAIERLPVTHLLRKSPLYDSKAWGRTDQADFLNMVAEISTGLDASTLLRHCKLIEQEQGREPGEPARKWGPRPIDIDILTYGTEPVRSANLVVPHPLMRERRFVLQPLADLDPNITSPDGAPIKEVLQSERIASQQIALYERSRKSGDAQDKG